MLWVKTAGKGVTTGGMGCRTTAAIGFSKGEGGKLNDRGADNGGFGINGNGLKREGKTGIGGIRVGIGLGIVALEIRRRILLVTGQSSDEIDALARRVNAIIFYFFFSKLYLPNWMLVRLEKVILNSN